MAEDSILSLKLVPRSVTFIQTPNKETLPISKKKAAELYEALPISLIIASIQSQITSNMRPARGFDFESSAI